MYSRKRVLELPRTKVLYHGCVGFILGLEYLAVEVTLWPLPGDGENKIHLVEKNIYFWFGDCIHCWK